MTKFLKFTMPATGPTPERPILIATDHIISVFPRYITHPDDKMKVVGEKRMIQEGTYIETTAHYGDGETNTLHVTEEFHLVLMILPDK